MNRDELLDRVNALESVICVFFAAEKQVPSGACGQMIGCECYKIYYTGSDKAPIYDAIAELRECIGKVEEK